MFDALGLADACVAAMAHFATTRAFVPPVMHAVRTAAMAPLIRRIASATRSPQKRPPTSCPKAGDRRSCNLWQRFAHHPVAAVPMTMAAHVAACAHGAGGEPNVIRFALRTKPKSWKPHFKTKKDKSLKLHSGKTSWCASSKRGAVLAKGLTQQASLCSIIS